MKYALPALRLSMRVAHILIAAKNSFLLGFCGGIWMRLPRPKNRTALAQGLPFNL
jgi:hypothetical protein